MNTEQPRRISKGQTPNVGQRILYYTLRSRCWIHLLIGQEIKNNPVFEYWLPMPPPPDTTEEEFQEFERTVDRSNSDSDIEFGRMCWKAAEAKYGGKE